MKNSERTHGERYAAFLERERVRRRRMSRRRSFVEKVRIRIQQSYRAELLKRRRETAGDRPATKAPHDKERRRRRARIAAASRRRNR